jgi:hypothetical protein
MRASPTQTSAGADWTRWHITDSSPFVPISKLLTVDRADVACQSPVNTLSLLSLGGQPAASPPPQQVDMLLESKRRRMIETSVSATPCAMQAATVRSVTQRITSYYYWITGSCVDDRMVTGHPTDAAGKLPLLSLMRRPDSDQDV